MGKQLFLKKLIITLLVLFTGQLVLAQITITGKVDDESGVPLPGVNIIVKGTTNGTQTDFDGNYSIVASGNATLSFSYIGLKTQEIVVGNRNVINVTMIEDAAKLDEVVITAFGIAREQKSVTYAAQNVETNEMKAAKPINAASALSGKVAGISVTQSANGVGSPARVVLRGNRSITGNSQPLYVVDGVPLGDDISNISPDDIKSISVLRGPNAAALYGNRANNGAIVITTISGNGAVGTKVSINTSMMTSTPILLWDYQNEYGQGIDGIYSPSSVTSWGPALDGRTVAHWSPNPDFGVTSYEFVAQPNNVRDFYETGYNLSTNVSVATTREGGETYFSYTYTDAEGVVPNNALERHNLNLRASQKILNKLTLDSKLNYIRSNFDNFLYTGESFANPNRHALRLPRNIRTADVSQYQFLAPNGTIDQNYWKPNDNGGANPYWTANKNVNEILDERVIGLLSLKYEFTNNLSLLVRSALDRTSFKREDRWSNDTYLIAPFGKYDISDEVRSEWNSDALLNYNSKIGNDFKLDLSVGANIRVQNTQGSSITTPSNTGLNIENLFSVFNIANPVLGQTFLRKEVQSVYTFGQLGYKDFLYLDATFRNDWSSTLPKQNRSFSYPSFGLTAVVSEVLNLPEAINFVKLRANYAKVGNDTDPFRLSRTLNLIPGGNSGVLDPSNVLPADDLLPEETESLELGADLRFLNNRLGLNFTYYKSNSINQLFTTPVPIASGVSSIFQNGGDIQNKGVEVVLTATPIKNEDFSWDVTFNFSTNKSEVLRITEGFDQIAIPAGPPFWGNAVARVGYEYGEFFSKDFVRDENGNVIVNANGIPKITPGNTVPVGNFNPDWLGGISNQFRYKNFNLSFLIDIRQGGVVSSFTEAVMAADGLLTSTLPGRNGGVFGVDIYPGETAVTESGQPNNIQTTAQAVYSAIGGRNSPTGGAFVKDASNARLRELVLGFTLPKKSLGKLPIDEINISLIGRNLFFLWNKAEQFDPEVSPTAGSGQEGFNSFEVPTSRDIGLNLNITF